MSIAFESPTHRAQPNEAYFTPLNKPSILSPEENSSSVSTPYFTAPINPVLNQDFFNAIQVRHASQPTVLVSPPDLRPPPALTHHTVIAMERQQLYELMTKQCDRIMILDVRSFVQYSHARLRTAINVSIPNTILKRMTFTMDKVYEAIVRETDRKRLKEWQNVEWIIFYDQSSQSLPENCAASFLGTKLRRAGFKGHLHYLKGGFEGFISTHADQCESSPLPRGARFGGSLPFAMPMPTQQPSEQARRRPQLNLGSLPASGPFTAPMPQFENQEFNPFFANIRQNMELSHDPIRERFMIRLPAQCTVQADHVKTHQQPRLVAGSCIQDDAFLAPCWLQNTVKEGGAQLLAEMYEASCATTKKIERTEQRRLQNVMLFHSKHTNNPEEFPLSIVAGIEMGSLNRYTNIWPYEYTRVKVAQPQTGTGYINASYIQYADAIDAHSSTDHVSRTSLQTMKLQGPQPYRRYISTQGPMPDTFADFWQVVWEQNSRVLVMLTKEEEMNKIKCHRYWPSVVGQATSYGTLTVTLLSETVRPVGEAEDDCIIIRQLLLARAGTTIRRKLTHLQYTGWMDFGVPDTPIGTLQIVYTADEAQVLHEQQQAEDDDAVAVGPMIVHCSAGCGRSGAFCAIDTVLRKMCRGSDNTTANQDLLLDTISRFREQRLSMVQTLRQFVFCYEAIWWWLLGYGHIPTSAQRTT
ncbi:hypothetical protein DFQ28_007292 [Apophysomyces sp. BC1034]|nr:hypothetical protein DFQ30_009186 [Apophysomyces sp. BC1015]KAG0172825.1 hypothetical protein DFQ29_008213 [Apophysomyces sp. BC1021]KAG0186799.1 hypothetical protein DFQ28_007292 [Apophysomyces sp. BC1034]